MCRFKSGIILKNKCVIAQGSNDIGNFEMIVHKNEQVQ